MENTIQQDSTREQQDAREQQIERLARCVARSQNPDVPGAFANYRDDWLRDGAALLDGPVARMIADAEQAAERRGAEHGWDEGWVESANWSVENRRAADQFRAAPTKPHNPYRGAL